MRDDTRELLIEIDRIRTVLDSLSARLARFKSENLPTLGRNDISANFAAQILDHSYTALETLFLRVSQFFENSLARDRWHTDLLGKMKLRIPGVREPLLSDSTYSLLVEMLRFRHFRRYYFDVDLDWHRIDFLLGVYDRAMPLVNVDIDRFKDFLRRLAAD
jgi:hypothetical protein